MEQPKPTKETVEFYDYSRVRDYLQQKYGYDERDYAGHFRAHSQIWKETLAAHGIEGDSLRGQTKEVIQAVIDEIDSKIPPYQDFWHFICDKASHITNGCYFEMSEDWFEDAEPWQREIGMRYLDEFGEGEAGERIIEFHLWW